VIVALGEEERKDGFPLLLSLLLILTANNVEDGILSWRQHYLMAEDGVLLLST
jgi:hypothetical protein